MWLPLISILDITLHMIFLMMIISIDNVELYLFKGIIYCESLICVPWVWNSHSFVLIVHLCIQHNCGGITKNLPLLNYKLLIITFFKCFLACPNMKALVTYAHFLTFNAANL